MTFIEERILRQILQNIWIGQAGVSLLPAVELKIWDAVHVNWSGLNVVLADKNSYPKRQLRPWRGIFDGTVDGGVEKIKNMSKFRNTVCYKYGSLSRFHIIDVQRVSGKELGEVENLNGEETQILNQDSPLTFAD